MTSSNFTFGWWSAHCFLNCGRPACPTASSAGPPADGDIGRQSHRPDVACDSALAEATSGTPAHHCAEQTEVDRLCEDLQRPVRDECLNERLFCSLTAAHRPIEAQRIDYNTARACTNSSPRSLQLDPSRGRRNAHTSSKRRHLRSTLIGRSISIPHQTYTFGWRSSETCSSQMLPALRREPRCTCYSLGNQGVSRSFGVGLRLTRHLGRHAGSCNGWNRRLGIGGRDSRNNGLPRWLAV